MVTAERNRSIDALKGMLIFTVVLGHVLLGSLDDAPMRYLIYSFHMPAFFFVSGYLLSLDWLRQTSFLGLLKKYWKRMLFPWCIAWLVYTLYASHNDFSLSALARLLYKPYYHLWFVPSLYFCILICASFAKIMKDNITVEVALGCLGMFLCLLQYSSLGIDGIISCGNLAYFVLGVSSKRSIMSMTASGGGNCVPFVCHGYTHLGYGIQH